MQYVIQKALYTGMLSIYSTPMTTVVDKRARTSLKLKPGATIMQLRNRLLMLCEDKDYDPIEEMINLVKEGYKVKIDGQEATIPLDVKDVIVIHKEISGYITPKIKTVDITEKVDIDIKVTVKKFGDTPPGKILEGEVIRDIVEDAVEKVDVADIGEAHANADEAGDASEGTQPDGTSDGDEPGDSSDSPSDEDQE